MKTSIKTIPFLIIACSLSLGSLASAQGKKKDIVDTAVGAGQFNTLAAALKAGGLVGTLKGKGPFTVFAPTDAAFAKLPKGTVESLLKPENKSKLVDILTYHVVSGKVPSNVAVTLSEANAVNKKKLNLAVKGKNLFINKSKVTKADINCSNGVIHVIDTVLLPPTPAKRGHSAAPKPSVQSVIHTALHEGGNQYHHHNIGATAAIYEVAAKALVLLPSNQISDADRNRLNNAIGGNYHHDHHAKAWAYYQALSSMAK